MIDILEQKYTLGFVFDNKLEKVLLIHKQKPEWQKGKVNGVWGKYEMGETPEICIRRETTEETGLVIDEKNWIYVGTIYQEIGDCGILAAQYRGDLRDAISNENEEVEWFDINMLPANILSNVSWLIPLSLDKLRGRFKSFSVHN